MGSMTALTFANPPQGRPPLLLSAGSELDPREPKRRLLVLRLWDVVARKELDRAAGGEFQGIRPWLAAWSVAPDHTRIRAAAAWTHPTLLVWDVGAAAPRLLADPHEGRSTVLTYLPERRMLLTGHFGKPSVGLYPEGYLDSWGADMPTVPTKSTVVSWAAGRSMPPDVKGMPV